MYGREKLNFGLDLLFTEGREEEGDDDNTNKASLVSKHWNLVMGKKVTTTMIAVNCKIRWGPEISRLPTVSIWCGQIACG